MNECNEFVLKILITQTCVLTPVFALLLCTSISVTKCDLPEPSVEFYQSTTGFKTSVSGLSVALTGEWRAHYGIM